MCHSLPVTSRGEREQLAVETVHARVSRTVPVYNSLGGIYRSPVSLMHDGRKSGNQHASTYVFTGQERDTRCCAPTMGHFYSYALYVSRVDVVLDELDEHAAATATLRRTRPASRT